MNIYSNNIRSKAIRLRIKGFSLSEIADRLKVSKSTTSLWLRAVVLDSVAKQRIEQRKKVGREKAKQIIKSTKQKRKLIANKVASEILQNIKVDKKLAKLLCALLFWAEGGKFTDAYVVFMNSDPIMIATFIGLLKKGFDIKKEKFRALVHVHDYHNEPQIKSFWSKVTQISLKQFYKSYRKPHTTKRKRRNYKGSVSIRYYSAEVARELQSIYTIFGRSFYGGVS